MKLKLLTIIFLSLFIASCGSNYMEILAEARHKKTLIPAKKKAELEAAKKSFSYYKEVYEKNKNLLGKKDLQYMAEMYGRLENNHKMKRRLLIESEAAPIRS